MANVKVEKKIGFVIERLEAWSDGEQKAELAADERKNGQAAEGHWNTQKNYAELIGTLREALDEMDGHGADSDPEAPPTLRLGKW